MPQTCPRVEPHNGHTLVPQTAGLAQYDLGCEQCDLSVKGLRRQGTSPPPGVGFTARAGTSPPPWSGEVRPLIRCAGLGGSVFLACGAPVPVFPRRVYLLLVFVPGRIGAVRGLFAVVSPRGSRPPLVGLARGAGPGRWRRLARFVRGSLGFIGAARARLRLDCAVWLCAGALAFVFSSFACGRPCRHAAPVNGSSNRRSDRPLIVILLFH